MKRGATRGQWESARLGAESQRGSTAALFLGAVALRGDAFGLIAS